MPRQARLRSTSGIYHVILRGINRQTIFEDEEDKEKFLFTLTQYKEKGNYQILGYCLMENHVHLLIKEGNEVLESSMKRIGVSYVYWYNWKYRRSGHLFQDRFKSEPVEDDTYLLAVLRYIHRNPQKAQIVQDMADYKWSSYHEYIGNSLLVATELVSGMFSDQKERMKEYFNQTDENDLGILDDANDTKLNDEEAREKIINVIGQRSLYELQQNEKSKRDPIIRQLKLMDGISIRQLARITGFTVNVIAKA